jgi:hypothetical protein
LVAVRGENEAVTPLGRPLALGVTGVPYRSAGAWKETVILVR